MKKQFIAAVWVFYTICTAYAEPRFITVGASKAKECWVYLGGLAESFDIPEEQQHRQILHDIGHELNIRIITLRPRHRCMHLGNKICWPHKDPDRALATYQTILADLQGLPPITGWIGFSNGGYFLQEISKQKNLAVPIVTISAAGTLEADSEIYVIIGRDDRYAFARAKELGYKFIESEGGHSIDPEVLKKTLRLILARRRSGS